MFTYIVGIRLKIICFFTFFLFPFFMPASMVQANESNGVQQAVFLPFSIKIAGDYNHLRDGLTTILTNRVVGSTDIRVMADHEIAQRIADLFASAQQEQAFREIDKSGVDYLIMGELSEDKEGLLATVQVISRVRTPSLRSFYRRAASMDDLMTTMVELAGAISADIVGVAPLAKQIDRLDERGIDPFQSAHPMRAYKKGVHGGIMPGLKAGGFEMISSRRSATIPLRINDMDAADLNGDGQVEIILAESNAIHIYKFAGGNFSRVDTIELAPQLRVHALSTGDLDNNGIKEIYISANHRKRPSSVVIEWDGSQSRILASRLPWYLRVISSQGNPLLLAQVAGRFGSSEVIGSRVYRLALQAGEYRKTTEFTLPEGLTIFDIALADLDGSGEETIVAISRDNHLLVYDRAGRIIWADPGQFGASANYLGTIAELAADEIEKIYVPTRIVVRDITGDGIDDIMVGMNRMSFVRYMRQHRYFEGNTIAALSWENNQLVPLWETRKLPDYLINSQLLVNNEADQSLKLFFALSQSTFAFAFWQGEGVRLVYYRLQVSGNKQ